MSQTFFDPGRYKWREVTGGAEFSYKVRHDYTILGADAAAGTLDMVVRWDGDGGHCHVHRHIATTTVLVLAGEQHLWDLLPDGTHGEYKVRSAGDYALTVRDQVPHLERGGEEGGIVFFGAHTSDGVLYELYDDDMKVLAEVTIESLMADWQANSA